MNSSPAHPAVQIDLGDLDALPRPGSPQKLAHIVYRTPRLSEMMDWYATVLNGTVVFADKRLGFVTYDQEHHRVALVRVPRALRIPGQVWKLHRKVWGVDHVAFTYDQLDSLVANYRRLADIGVEPVWCINHGPTTSMYYEDPDGNRIELQVDNFASNRDLLAWLAGGEFDSNPIGVEFDPVVLERLLAQGVPGETLLRRGSAPPDGRKARAGMRTLRWKTL